ncbi:hypothetical protein [Bradyrhizobium sp. NAS96.2]|uniref:hypothetical protein n=1 Tax=Bradyrhizobium sp. NAS96.2 TaxID=1680160 RepID=UPI001161283C|nr:hypothetical protein [Bradyrhizobium sp. NAS96.2]
MGKRIPEFRAMYRRSQRHKQLFIAGVTCRQNATLHRIDDRSPCSLPCENGTLLQDSDRGFYRELNLALQ